MLKVSKVTIISAILEDLCKRIQGRCYLSNLGRFVLKESKVTVISAILDGLC